MSGFTPDEELAMEQVTIGECGMMSEPIAHHVHRVAAHALARRCSDLTQRLAEAERARDSARSQLARLQADSAGTGAGGTGSGRQQ